MAIAKKKIFHSSAVFLRSMFAKWPQINNKKNFTFRCLQCCVNVVRIISFFFKLCFIHNNIQFFWRAVENFSWEKRARNNTKFFLRVAIECFIPSSTLDTTDVFFNVYIYVYTISLRNWVEVEYYSVLCCFGTVFIFPRLVDRIQSIPLDVRQTSFC